MQKAAKSFETLHGAADSTAASLHNANSAFLNSVRSLDKSLAPMRNKIGQLRDILEAQKKSQDAFLNHVGNSVSRLAHHGRPAFELLFERPVRVVFVDFDEGLRRVPHALELVFGVNGPHPA